MLEAEFDRFAAEYREPHAASIRLSGEVPEFFAYYKIALVFRAMAALNVRPRRILDFGSGVGNSLGPMHECFPGRELVCLDVSRKSLDIAERRFAGLAHFEHFDGRSIPYPDDHFDLAFTACVFHHIPSQDHLPLLREIHRVMTCGGHFFLFEHNPLNPLTVKAVKDCPFDENAELIRARDMIDRLRAAGLSGPAVSYHLFFPHFLAVMRPIERYLTKIPLGAQYSIHAVKNLG